MSSWNSDHAKEGPSKQQTSTSTTNGEIKQRNRRLLANIQSALGAPNGTLKTRKQRPLPNGTVLKFANISEMLSRLKLADEDTSVSLCDIRPYILENEKTFDEEDLRLISKDFCVSALMQTNAHYIVGLCIDLCYNRAFLEELANHLKAYIELFIVNVEEDEEHENIDALPEFFAQLAMAKWPRGKDKAFEISNPVLFNIINAVMGWINMIIDYSNRDDVIEDDEMSILSKCCEAVYLFCMTGQRSIWLNFPDVFDKVYEATKSLLTSNLHLPRSLKSSFLQLFTLLNKWSVNNTKKYTSSSTQTIKL